MKLKGICQWMNKNRCAEIIYFLLSTFIICGQALYNGYPLVTNDSGIYILSSFSLIPPIRFPIGYGLFIRIFSWEYTMWMVIYVQALIMNLLIYKAISLAIPTKKNYFIHLSIIIFLVLFSSLGWYSSQLMPDIFTPGIFLIFFILLIKPKLSVLDAFVYLTVLFFFLICQLNNLLTSALSILTFLILLLFRSKVVIDRANAFKRLLLLSTGLICSVIFLMIYQYYNGNGFRLSLEPHVLLAVRLSENGLLRRYLDENSDRLGNQIYQDIKLMPITSHDFFQTNKSHNELMRSSIGEWKRADSLYAPIVYGIMTTPRYLIKYIWENVKGTGIQLYKLNVGDEIRAFRENSLPYLAIKDHLDNDGNEFLHTSQNYGKLKFNTIDFINYFVIGISLILIFWSFFNGRISKSIILLNVICLLGYFYNAVVTTSLIGISSHLQSRISWLLVLDAMIIMYSLIYQTFNLSLLKPARPESDI